MLANIKQVLCQDDGQIVITQESQAPPWIQES